MVYLSLLYHHSAEEGRRKRYAKVKLCISAGFPRTCSKLERVNLLEAKTTQVFVCFYTPDLIKFSIKVSAYMNMCNVHTYH